MVTFTHAWNNYWKLDSCSLGEGLRRRDLDFQGICVASCIKDCFCLLTKSLKEGQIYELQKVWIQSFFHTGCRYSDCCSAHILRTGKAEISFIGQILKNDMSSLKPQMPLIKRRQISISIICQVKAIFSSHHLGLLCFCDISVPVSLKNRLGCKWGCVFRML